MFSKFRIEVRKKKVFASLYEVAEKFGTRVKIIIFRCCGDDKTILRNREFTSIFVPQIHLGYSEITFAPKSCTFKVIKI